MKHEDLTPFLPLSPAVLHICLALVREDRHGYGIMQEVARESGGGCRLGPGTLYDNLQRLISQSQMCIRDRSRAGSDHQQ